MAQTEQRYRLHWRNKTTGATGNGMAVFSKERAAELVIAWEEAGKGVYEYWYGEGDRCAAVAKAEAE